MNMPIRWQFILGNFAEDALALPGENGEGIRKHGTVRMGGREASALSVPTWVAKIRRLFPRRAAEILQKEALEKYHLTEILTDPEILKTMEPNIDLLKNILSFKDIIPDEVKSLAYKIVEQAVCDIEKKTGNQNPPCFYRKETAQYLQPLAHIPQL